MKHEIIVGNIGTVYSGDRANEARIEFEAYSENARNGYGRAAGEDVTWFKGGEIYKEALAAEARPLG